MVSRKRKQYREMTYTDLAKAGHSNDDAWSAMNRFAELVKSGKDPEILYSEFNGWLVRDRNEIR